jgi:hypothetical protein
MKMNILLMLAMGIAIVSCGQRIAADKVPSVVVNAVKAKFPNATDIDWKKIQTGYEAEFDIGKIDYASQIAPSGVVIMHKQDIPPVELPAGISALISSRYSDYKVDEVEKIQKGDNVYYQVELDGKNQKDINLVFSGDGKEEHSIPYWD